jgi:ABC-2 type transport system ATP-binding protein
MNLLSVENIVKTYANHTALDGVSLEVPEGSIFGLLGPNGAGKTSLIRIINQITGPDSGRILFAGEELNSSHISQIGYLPEERGLYKKMGVGEQAIYLATLKGMSKKDAKNVLKEWFERFDIMGWWDKKVEELSKGMAQKVQFITTVMHEPRFIILDEPFSGFDPINANLIKKEIIQLVEKGTTVMLSTHNMGSVEEICTHIALINKSKKVLEGPVFKVREDFKEGVYDLTFKGDTIGLTNAMWTNFELVEHHKVAKLNTARIKLLNNSTVNDLLKLAINEVQVESINEVIPSMNDIFIKVVEKQDTSDE